MTDKEILTNIIHNAQNKYLNLLKFESSLLADYLIANNVIPLPCKFLQKCFVIPTIENNLSDITEMKCIGFSLSYDSYNANLITDKNKLYQPCFGAFGKTVFLTKEEAEEKLKEREGK